MEVKQVTGINEEPQLPPLPSRRKRRKIETEVEVEDDEELAKGVFRLFQAEGTIGDVAYATSVVMRKKVRYRAFS